MDSINVGMVEKVPKNVLQKCVQVDGFEGDFCLYNGDLLMASKIAGNLYIFNQIPNNTRLLNKSEKGSLLDFLQERAHYFAGLWEGATGKRQVRDLTGYLSFYRVMLARLLKFELGLDRQLALLHNLYTYTALSLEDISALLNVKARKTTLGLLERAGIKIRRYQKRQAAAKFSESLMKVTPPPAPPPPLFDPDHIGPSAEQILTQFLEYLAEEGEAHKAWVKALAAALDVDRYAARALVHELADMAHHPTTQDVVRAFVRAQYDQP